MCRTLVCCAGPDAASAPAVLTDSLIPFHTLRMPFYAAFGPAIVCQYA